MRMKYAKNDFSQDNLPLNRRKQFGAIFKNEWRTLLRLGLFFLLPVILLLVLEFFKWTLYASMIASSEEGADLGSIRLFVEVLYNGALLLVYSGFAVVLAGSSRVIQRLVYGEGLLFKGDFLYGIKHNFRQIFIFTLIFWITKMLVVFGSNMLKMQDSSLDAILAGVLDAVFGFIITPICFIACSYSVTYKMKIKTELSNAFKTFLMKILIPLLFGGIVFGLGYIDIYYLGHILIVIPIVQVVFTLFFMPVLILLWHLYMTSIFDRYINENNYPEIYLKGLRDYNYEGEKSYEHHDNAND